MDSAPMSPTGDGGGFDKPQALSWEDALQYRVARLPSIVNPDTQKRELLPYNSRVGRFCKDTACNRKCACGGIVSDFVPFGSAITSTFKAQIGFIGTFAFLSVLMIPAIAINSYGQTAVGGQAVYSIATTTLGNLPLIPRANMTDAFIDVPLTNTTLNVRTAAVLYASLDLIGVAVFLFMYAALRNGLRMEEEQVDKASITAEDYTIFLPDIPSDTTEEELRLWADRQTKTKKNPEGYVIADINIVDDNVGLLRLYTQRGQIFRALARVDRGIREVKASIGSRPQSCCYDGEYMRLAALQKTYEALKGRADALTDQAKVFKSKGATAAFITFESQDAAETVLNKYPDSFFAWACQGPQQLLKNKQLVVKAAPAPDTIQWHNLNIKSGSQNARQCFTGLVAAALILLSFLFIVFASLTNAEIQESLAPPDCSGIGNAFTNGTYTNTTLLAMSPSSTVVKCYCPTLGFNTRETWDTIINDPFAEKCPELACTRLITLDAVGAIRVSYCFDWVRDRANALGLTVGASVSIALVNILLAMTMRFMTQIEGHHSTDDLNKSLVLRLFFAQFLNTAVLTIIINAAWDTITGQKLPIPGTGKYDDFSQAWFKTVGASYHSTMITLAITPHIGILVGMLCNFRSISHAQTQVERQKAIDAATGGAATAGEAVKTDISKLPKPVPVPKKWKAQADLNDSLVGPPADYVLRYVQMMITIYVCYIFASGMPLMIVIATISLTIGHLVDKAVFLYWHKRPPASNNAVLRYVVELLPVAALLHLGIGIWMLGSMTTIRDALLDAAGLSESFALLQAYGGAQLRSGIIGTGYKRITQLQSVPLLFLFVVVLGALALRVAIATAGTIVWGVFDGLTGGNLSRLRVYCKTCCDKDGDGDGPTYTQAISPPLVGTPGGINGVKSYNVLENPEIQRMFGISAEFAASHKGLAAVSKFSVEDAINAALSPSRAKIMLETAAISGTSKSDLALTPSRPSFFIEEAEAVQLSEPPATVQVVPVDVTDGAGVVISNPMLAAAPAPVATPAGSSEAPVVLNPLHAPPATSASSAPEAAGNEPVVERRTSKIGGLAFFNGEFMR